MSNESKMLTIETMFRQAVKHKATIPTQGSKLYNILMCLLSGKRLTVQTAITKFHTTELRKHVSRLKRYKWDIRGAWVTENGDWFKVYWMEV